MSYVLFARTSNPFGLRQDWVGPGTVEVATTQGRVNGLAATVDRSDFDAFDPLVGDVVTADFAVHDIDVAAFAGGGLAANLADGKVLAGGAGPSVAGGLDALELSFALQDLDWNGIKSIELALGAGDVNPLERIVIENFVDVRVKLAAASFGDDIPGLPSTEFLPSLGDDVPLELSITNAKRGEVQAFGLSRPLHLDLSLASNNSGWQNSFEIRATNQDDVVTLLPGDNTGTAEFGALVNDGSLALVRIELGLGADLYDGTASSADTILDAGDDDGVVTPGSTPVILGGDRLLLGAGSDRILYQATLFGVDGYDTVENFEAGSDQLVIDLDEANFTATVTEAAGMDTIVTIRNAFSTVVGLVKLEGVLGLSVGGAGDDIWIA